MAVTIGSVILSLVYSEYFGFVPCSLCWLQRIAVYPQALLSVLAFRLRDETHFPVYGIGLSIFGVAVALYQYVYQMLPKDVVTSHTIMPCLADGSNADCAVKVIDVFGFITFPLISAVTFAFLIIVYLYMLRSQKHHSVSH
jgi:disulfide bond formation protein DsbB